MHMGACNCSSHTRDEAQFTLADQERLSQLHQSFYHFSATKPQSLPSLLSDDFKFWNLGPAGAPCCGHWEGSTSYLQKYIIGTVAKKMTISSQEVKETYSIRNAMISVVEVSFSAKDPKSVWSKESFSMVSVQLFNFIGGSIDRIFEIWADFPQDSIKLPWKMALKYQISKPLAIPKKKDILSNLEKMNVARATKGHDGIKPFYEDTTYLFLYGPSFWNISLASRGYTALKRMITINFAKTFEIIEEKSRVVYVEENVSFEFISARAKSLKEGCPFEGREYSHYHFRQLFWDGAKIQKSVEIIAVQPLDSIPTPFV